MASAIAILMLDERGVLISHSTAYRRVLRCNSPEIENRLRRQTRRPRSTNWRVNETYVKVRGEWAYLCRALDRCGNTIGIYLLPTRNGKAAKRFLGKTLNGLKDWDKPEAINTDKAPTCGIAVARP